MERKIGEVRVIDDEGNQYTLESYEKPTQSFDTDQGDNRLGGIPQINYRIKGVGQVFLDKKDVGVFWWGGRNRRFRIDPGEVTAR